MIDVTEVSKLTADVAAEVDKIDKRVEAAVGRATEHIYHLSRVHAPRDTGELYNSIQRDTSGMSRRVFSPTKQGFFQEYGTSKMPPQPWLMVFAPAAGRRLAKELEDAGWDGQ